MRGGETVIRPAVPADLDGIKTCAELAYAIYVERIGRKPAPMVADFARLIEQAAVQVAVAHDRVCGFIVSYPSGDHILLENVAVNPDFQGCGIGTRLIARVEQCAKQDGFECVELYTNAKMTENLGLYPRLGYEQFDRRLEDGFDRVYFRKKL